MSAGANVLSIVTPTTGLPVRLADGSGYLAALPVTDNGGSLTVDGTVAVSGSVAVTGTFWQATQPVSLASVPSHDVTNGGTFAVQAAQSGTWNVGTVTTLTGVTNVVHVDDNSGTLSVDDGGGSLTVDGSVSVSGLVPGVTATSLGKAEDAVAADGDTGVMMLAVRKDSPATTVGAAGDYHPLEVDANGRLWCSATIDAALPAGTNAIGKLAANTGVTIGAVEIAASQTLATVTTVSTVTTCSTLTGGGVAHDGVDSGNPHLVGAHATTSVSGGTNVTDADRTYLKAGVDGVLINRPHCNLEDIVTATPVAITDGSSTSVISAQGVGVKVYLTEVCIANSSSSNVTVDLRDGTGGSVKWTFPVPANGGVVKAFATPLPFTANTAVAADPSAAASTITVSALGFKSKV